MHGTAGWVSSYSLSLPHGYFRSEPVLACLWDTIWSNKVLESVCASDGTSQTGNKNPLGATGLGQQGQRGLEQRDGGHSVDLEGLADLLDIDDIKRRWIMRDTSAGNDDVNVIKTGGSHLLDGLLGIGGGSVFDSDEDQLGAISFGQVVYFLRLGTFDVTDTANDIVVGLLEILGGNGVADAYSRHSY